MEPYEAAVTEAIRTRIANRHWYRAHRWPRLAELERENDAKLRELLAVHRIASRMTHDVIDDWKAIQAQRDERNGISPECREWAHWDELRQWTETELRLAAGDR